ncbi:hypothetical protein [Acanthamoeba polyphaga mimivirus]|nr:hypothetical protein [Acanthamoeba polyphaga mimivirus]
MCLSFNLMYDKNESLALLIRNSASELSTYFFGCFFCQRIHKFCDSNLLYVIFLGNKVPHMLDK